MSPSILRATRPILLGVIVALVAGVSSVATAGEYSVQIGAFRDVESGYAERATAVGELYTERTRAGVTRFQIGRFASKQAAQAARSALIGAGYADAFVVEKAVADASRPDAAPSADPLASVPDSLRSRVVLLDGAYQVKEGDRFVPLAEALASED